MEVLATTVFILAISYAVIRFWEMTVASFLAVAAITVLMMSCSHATTLQVSAVIESEDDRPAMEGAVRYAAVIYRNQLGVDLVLTHVEVGMVAAHTHADALLDALQAYRMDHRYGDVTVLFTRRDIREGGRDFAGIATTGPACSAAASAIVELRGDGLDGQILAHEIAHTLGAMHDAMPGYLMSEHSARAGWEYFSPDSVATVNAAPLAQCMAPPAATNPPPVSAHSAPSGAVSSPSGGGGGMGCTLMTCLAVLAAVRQYFNAAKAREAAHYWATKYRRVADTLGPNWAERTRA